MSGCCAIGDDQLAVRPVPGRIAESQGDQTTVDDVPGAEFVRMCNINVALALEALDLTLFLRLASAGRG